MIQYRILSERPGETRTLVADYSARIQNLAFSSNERGFAECTGFVPMGLTEAFGLYNTLGSLRVEIADTSGGAVYDGRLEDIAIVGDGVTITALGFSRALSDAPYTALWSDTRVSGWRPLTGDQVTGGTPERFVIDTNNRLYIAPQKNSTQSNALIGVLGYTIPSLSTRDIIGVQFDWLVAGPINWQARLRTGNASYGTIADVWTLNANGGTQVGSTFLTFAACQSLQFFFFFNAAAAVFANETGSAALRITNLRVVTSTTNKVDTTITIAQGAGANITCNVVSNANMYVGQRLHIGVPAAAGETVIVKQLIFSTQFVADFTAAAGVGVNVQAHVIYGDEIVKDIVGDFSTLNSNQLSSQTALINSPRLDLQNECYQDANPADVLDYLAGVGDFLGKTWEWGVKDYKLLYYRLKNSSKTERIWYVDISDLNITRLLDQLTNSVYAVYQDASNITIRTAATTDSTSVARYGITRQAAQSVSTTSATQAGIQQAAALTDGKDPLPQSGITVTRVFDGNGVRWPLWYVNAADTVIIRNLPPNLSSAIDRIRVFRLARCEYNFTDDKLTLEPETPIPTLDALLAKLAAGISTT